MKKHIAISGLAALFVLQSANADQPNIRSQSRSRDTEEREERPGGIRGFFRGVVGEIREGREAIKGGYRDVRDGIRGRHDDDDDMPESDGPSRYGYKSPPPPALNDGGGLRAPRDPGAPAGGNIAASRNGVARDGGPIATSAKRERTLPRKPASTPVADSTPNPPRIQDRAAPPQPSREIPAPRLDTAPPAPRREVPVVERTPARTTPGIVAPKDLVAPPAPTATPPSPVVKETPPAPKVEEQTVAKDEAGRPLPDKPDFPTATATKDPGVVLSPYPPYDLLDVKGMAPGSLAKDPATGQVFRVP